MCSKKYLILSYFFSIARSEQITGETVKSEVVLSALRSLKTVFFFITGGFRNVFSFAFRFIQILITPILWTVGFSWKNVVLRPLDLFLYINHVLYPITMFCLAAVCCGLIIGGCSGFAAEAVSSLVVTATWGPQKTQPKIEYTDSADDEEMEETEDSVKEEDMLEHISTSSYGRRLYRGSSDEQSTSMQPLKKSSVTTARKQPSPILVRRMKLSRTSITRKDSWDWDAEDDLTRKKTH